MSFNHQRSFAMDDASGGGAAITDCVPAPLTPLLGRRRLLSRASHLIRGGETRMMTCTGAPGVGKTRFAIELTRIVADDYVDGVVFIDCSQFVSGSDLLAALASRYGTEATFPSVVGEMSGLHLLLVLDSCDRAVDDAPLLVDLLRACPAVTLLVTSRRALQVRGELALDVPPLPVPPRRYTGSQSLDDLANNPSAQLFLQRARSVSAPVTLNEHNAEDIVEICRAMDGLPLAIELIAQRTRLFPVRSIRERLDNVLPLLTGGPLDLPQRLRSMSAAVAWSYECLSEREQRVFRQLAIFIGSFSLDFVEHILAPTRESTGIDAAEILDVVDSLTAKGLMEPSHTSAPDVRFRMLRPIRAYGLALLRDSGDAPALFRRMLSAHADRIRARPAVLLFPGDDVRNRDEQSTGMNLLNTALQFGSESIAEGLVLVSDVWLSWWEQNTIGPGVEVLSQLLERSEHAPMELRAAGYRILAMLMVQQERHLAAERPARFSLDLARISSSPREIAASLHALAYVLLWNDELTSARELLSEALGICADQHMPDVEAAVHQSIGDIAMTEGDLIAAAHHHERVYELRVRMARQVGAAWAAFNLMKTALMADDLRQARRWYEVGMEFALAEQHDVLVAELKFPMATVEHLSGNPDTARRLAEDALEQYSRTDPRELSREAVRVIAEYLRLVGDYRGAAQAVGAATRHQSSVGFQAPNRARIRVLEFEKVLIAELGLDEYRRYRMIGTHRTIPQTVSMAMESLRRLQTEERSTPWTPVVTHAEAPVEQVPSLTPRELEVLELVSHGLGDKAIADQLSISPRTAMTHVGNIMTKLTVHSRSAASMRGIQLGLIEDPRIDFDDEIDEA